MTTTPVPSTTDDLLAEIEAQAAAMTDTAATLVRVIRAQEVTIAALESAQRTKPEAMTTEQLLEELEQRLLERRERKGK